MATKTYSDKLKDPRWQKKRLEIMQRDNFTCQKCGSTTNTLNVHHKKYSGNPWESPNEDLTTICENCHKKEHDIRQSIAEKHLIDGEWINEKYMFDEHGRRKFTKDNPDYPPIYKNGFNNSSTPIFANELFLSSNKELGITIDQLDKLKFSYSALKKRENEGVVYGHIEYLESELTSLCDQSNITIIDDGGRMFGTEGKNYQYF